MLFPTFAFTRAIVTTDVVPPATSATPATPLAQSSKSSEISRGTDYWLSDGFHRVAAAEKSGRTRIEAEIRPGSLADAQWYSFGVNKTHGLRRSNEDKRRAVEGALMHEKGSGRTNEVIAEHCGVDSDLVRRCREALESGGGILQVTKRVGKDGKTYNVSKTQEANKKRATKTTTSETTTHKTIVESPTEADFVEEHEEPKRAYVLEGLAPAFHLARAGDLTGRRLLLGDCPAIFQAASGAR